MKDLKNLITNYRIGQKIIIGDSGRFSAAMLALVRFFWSCLYKTVKPTTTTTLIKATLRQLCCIYVTLTV
jgi:hypothetical protein